MTTCFGVNRYIIGTLQDETADIMQLYFKYMVFMFLSCGIPHYKIIITIKL